MTSHCALCSTLVCPCSSVRLLRLTVKMDPQTGHISANCTDWRLAAVAPATALFDYVLSHTSNTSTPTPREYGHTAAAGPAAAILSSCLEVLKGCWPVQSLEAQCHNICKGKQQYKLRAAGCTERDIAKYCGGNGGGQHQQESAVMVSNGWNTAFEHQSMNVIFFAETGGVFDPRSVPDGTMPPAVPALMGGHLTTPLALSDITAQGQITEAAEYARFIMKSVLLHLRHGLLFGAAPPFPLDSFSLRMSPGHAGIR